MGTRSLIGIEQDEQVHYVYCHWDGHVSSNGRILFDHYKDRAKVLLLINQGSISILGKEIGEEHDFDDECPEMCTFYHRDRGEPRNVMVAKSAADFWRDSHGTEYWYLRDSNGQWWVSDHGDAPKLLEAALKEEDEDDEEK